MKALLRLYEEAIEEDLALLALLFVEEEADVGFFFGALRASP